MNYKGIELEPCQAVIQEKQNGEWVDFCTIKDGADCTYAELMVDGKHPTFKGEFRVMGRIHNDQSIISDLDKYLRAKVANIGYGSSEALKKI